MSLTGEGTKLSIVCCVIAAVIVDYWCHSGVSVKLIERRLRLIIGGIIVSYPATTLR